VPLAEIVLELDRYNRQRFMIADAGLACLRFGGSFCADDPEGFLALLAATAQLVVETRGNETVLRLRR
jgi:ferric-dicitrate binding protein FerR (iron transport regulator)